MQNRGTNEQLKGNIFWPSMLWDTPSRMHLPSQGLKVVIVVIKKVVSTLLAFVELAHGHALLHFISPAQHPARHATSARGVATQGAARHVPAASRY